MSQDTPNDRPQETPADDQNAPIPLEPRGEEPPRRPAPGKAHIDAPGLTDDFDEDADFESDPEVERIVKGIPVEGKKTGEARKPAPERARVGLLGVESGEPLCASEAWRTPAIIGGLVTLTAAVLAGVYADHTLWAFVLITIYRAALHTGTGIGALILTAMLLGRKVGSFEGAAARMFLCVSLFLVVYSLDIPIMKTSKLEESVLGAAAYFGGLVVAFRLPPRDAAVVGGSHFGVAMLLWLGGLLSSAIQAGALAGAGSGGGG
ncbi:MAG: hypothetical protein IT431_15060 [Phycisphaerales bacterium]|nr:hypothetical protein [Phycisphaerales bacterium]